MSLGFSDEFKEAISKDFSNQVKKMIEKTKSKIDQEKKNKYLGELMNTPPDILIEFFNKATKLK